MYLDVLEADGMMTLNRRHRVRGQGLEVRQAVNYRTGNIHCNIRVIAVEVVNKITHLCADWMNAGVQVVISEGYCIM